MKIIGIGIGAKHSLSLGAWEQIQSAEQLVLQTGSIPLADWLREQGVRFETLDAFYEQAEDFEELLALALAHLRQMPGATLCLMGELSQHKLAAALAAEGLAGEILPGVGFGQAALDLCAGAVCPAGAFLCPASEFEQSGFTGGSSLVLTELDSPYLAAELFSALARFYPADAPCHLVHLGRRVDLPLSDFPSFPQFDYSTTLVLDKPAFEQKACYDFADLLAVIARLRGENGCPWDREQTHESLRTCLIEECYEVLEAIDARDEFALADELGDVLLQVVMHAAIASEHGQFDALDVADGICRKMIRRHPHIFGDAVVKDSGEVMQNWEAIKRQEKAQKSLAQSLADIPSGMPALIRAQKIQKKAAQIGFDWENYEGALEKVREELTELCAALDGDGSTEEEAGDLLFSAVNLLRKLGVDAEPALLAACGKFADRMAKMESFASQQGQELAKMPLEEQDALWNRAKMCKKS